MDLTSRMLMMGAAAKSYADFVAHISTLNSPITSTSSADTPDSKGASTTEGVTSNFYIPSLYAGAGNMYGTPWNLYVSSDSPLSLMMIHAMPSLAQHTACIGTAVYLRWTAIYAGAFYALTRNGYTSYSFGSPSTGGSVPLMLYWDATTNSAKQMSPINGTGPTDYVF